MSHQGSDVSVGLCPVHTRDTESWGAAPGPIQAGDGGGGQRDRGRERATGSGEARG